ncbi:MAG: hypothetical protein FJ280_12565 [Planctomycetes bacterium]|nr:hypothetical protein [Planctomycetota bacterium]
MSSNNKPFVDQCVIYYARPDNCWVAHSLRTDQIGAADSVVEALAALLRAVDFILADAAEDPTLAVFRAAPEDIREMSRHAMPLPKEIYEIAHKMARGEWPKEFEFEFKATHRPYVAEHHPGGYLQRVGRRYVIGSYFDRTQARTRAP